MGLFERFRLLFAPSETHQRSAPIDGLRAIAAIWVIGLHTLSMTGSFWIEEARDVHVFSRAQFQQLMGLPALRLLTKGDLAVDLFFALSGFLIASSLFREQSSSGTIDLWRFYRRRWLRLFPVYAFAMALFVLLGRGSSSTLWANLLYVNNFIPTYDQFMLHAWSLAVEEQFYLLFPLLLLLARARRGLCLRHLLGALALSFAIRALVIGVAGLHLQLAANPVVGREAAARFNELLYDKFYTRYGAILCGVIAAHLEQRGATAAFFAERRRAVSALLVLALVVIAAICLPSPVASASDAPRPAVVFGFLVLYQTLFAGAATFVMLACLNGSSVCAPLSRVLRSPRWLPLARLSYSAYLIHPLVIQWVYLRLPPREPRAGLLFGYFVLFTVGSFVLAAPMYMFIEEPVLRLREAARQSFDATSPEVTS